MVRSGAGRCIQKVSAAPDFWAALAAPDLAERLAANFGDDDAYPVDDDYLDDVAAAFADVVDSKARLPPVIAAVSRSSPT